MGEKLTEFRRFITGTFAPHAAAHPNDTWVRHIVAQLNSNESTSASPSRSSSGPRTPPAFVMLPRRWAVERSLAWMMHARRHARDYERLVQHSETLITWPRPHDQAPRGGGHPELAGQLPLGVFCLSESRGH